MDIPVGNRQSVNTLLSFILPSIKTPGLAECFPPLLRPSLTVDLQSEVVPVDDAVPHRGVAAQQIIAVIVHQHVEHLALSLGIAVVLAPLHLQTVGYLDHDNRVDLGPPDVPVTGGAEDKPTGGVLPYLGHLSHP